MHARLAVVYMSIGPYHAARLNALAQRIDGLVAIEIASREERYPWIWQRANRFEWETLVEGSSGEVSYGVQAERLRRALDRWRPDVVMVSGYSDLPMRAAAVWASEAHARCIMTTDSGTRDKRRFLPAEIFKAQWCRRYYDALFLAGERSVRYFTELGFPEHLCWRGTDVVDNDHFWTGANAARSSATARARWGLPERFFLCVARFEKEKNLLVLLQAFRKYCENGGTWALVLVGRGSEEARLRHHIAESCATDIASRIAIHEWRSYEDLPSYYGLASCLVLPSSSEPWGLVVNEAMASGLPVIVSWNCGCVPELCHRGTNALLFHPDRVGELARCLMSISNCAEHARMAEASRRIVAGFTPVTWAEALVDCIRSIY
jgi:1,2-diacylglycerol 3-alpha-glucosyltransferase